MIRRLDLMRHYQEIRGGSGVKYEQDGIIFGPSGEEINPLSSPLPEPVPESVQIEKSLEDQHWRYLKAQVEMYGGTWTNKTDALNFLRRDKE